MVPWLNSKLKGMCREHVRYHKSVLEQFSIQMLRWLRASLLKRPPQLDFKSKLCLLQLMRRIVYQPLSIGYLQEASASIYSEPEFRRHHNCLALCRSFPFILHFYCRERTGQAWRRHLPGQRPMPRRRRCRLAGGRRRRL